MKEKTKKTKPAPYKKLQPPIVISTAQIPNGLRQLELNLISYSGKKPVWDIRYWRYYKNHEYQEKGVMLSHSDLLTLRNEVLPKINL